MIIPSAVCQSVLEIVAVIILFNLKPSQSIADNKAVLFHMACMVALLVIEDSTARPSIINPVLNELVVLLRAQESSWLADI
jgi:hypothetical protein